MFLRVFQQCLSHKIAVLTLFCLLSFSNQTCGVRVGNPSQSSSKGIGDSKGKATESGPGETADPESAPAEVVVTSAPDKVEETKKSMSPGNSMPGVLSEATAHPTPIGTPSGDEKETPTPGPTETPTPAPL